MNNLPEKCCGTCRWGRFEMTAHKPPKIKLGEPGECDFPLDSIAVPRSVGGKRFLYKCVAWPEWDRCPTWEVKQL